MTEEQANRHKHNPFDVTKVWPKADYPLIEVGVMELNRYPDNYFAEVEQAAFSPANVVPGIGFSPDKMLQGRLFSYGDTQRYRLGSQFQLDPGERSEMPVSKLSSRRQDAGRWQSRRHAHLSSQQRGSVGRPTAVRRAHAADRGSGRTLGSPRRR